MASFTNLFDLLGGNESDDDVTDLYERMKKKADEEVPSSPPKTRKEYIVFAAENLEHIDSRGNGNENAAKSDEEGWQVVHKKVYAKKIQENGNGLSNGSEPTKGKGDVNGKISMTNGNGNGRGGKKKGSGRYRGRGRGSVGNGNHDNESRDKDLSNGDNGDVVDAGNSEGDAAVTVESLNDKKSEEKETTEDIKSDIPKSEETAEEREERLRREEREERRRLRIQEAAEEARKMTLDQYEALLKKKKKQALNLKKTEARRVVSADEDFENMKEVGKKLDNDETLIVEKEKPKGKAALVKSTSESKLKKSESFEKGPKPLAVGLAKLFRPASFRSHKSRRGRDHENQGGFAHRLPSQNGSTSEDLPSNNGPPDEEVLKDEIQFPVLGSVSPALPSESSAPPANPSTSSEPNSSESSAPPSNPSTSSGC